MLILVFVVIVAIALVHVILIVVVVVLGSVVVVLKGSFALFSILLILLGILLFIDFSLLLSILDLTEPSHLFTCSYLLTLFQNLVFVTPVLFPNLLYFIIII